ncbi:MULTISPECIES: ABC transporter substrate-binding protein [unclassified Marinobacter]|uniref:ABC transporter substrate-binding protein n=1 Tax=unclassified Marinobacter TaxID=83889 RepID=UPI00071903A7|nr:MULTISPECIES: ABC transporter substrate-binding protein [unclassified Marinobacter]MDX5440595.1 ABC transporter substrate-binding protein [Alteromonadaceae bacterium]AMQ89515.1 iron ABC transporter substrate-binding protein [Marinobacter sp. LQ44]MDX5335795.1 ABC transporter substrate-binding protein [Marinobacter sp.]MDX5386804.1 ABC transporter substrate-binding protein [Marinobacter sp.]MDX5472205.1 ABC transporter substrate-binding protein [Marinobacter sp.]
MALSPFVAALLGGVLLIQAGVVQAARTVTDLADRQVSIPESVNRVILGESRYIPALAILDGDATIDRLAGILPDFEQTDPGGYAQYLERFPALAEVPKVGHASADSFSLESVLAIGADLAIFSLEGHGPGAHNRALIERLERAGVAVVFVDFRQQPLVNTPRSMALLGDVLGREQEAQRFNRFYREELARVSEVVSDIPPDNRPRVFLHSRLGLHDSCCETMVRGMMGRFIDAAGGRNVAADRVPGVSGVMNLEYLLSDPPDRYLATAIGSRKYQVSDADQPYVMLGAGVDGPMARESFRRATDRPGLRALEPIREQRAMAIWHHFYNTPMNVVAVQALARWLHPEALSELDPEQTLETFYREFQPVPLDGRYWITLGEETL